jgi:hypothetical protein
MREQAAPVSHQLTGYLLVPWFQLHKMCNPFGIPPVMRHKELLGDLPVEVHLHTSQLQHHASLLLLPPTVHSAYQKTTKNSPQQLHFFLPYIQQRTWLQDAHELLASISTMNIHTYTESTTSTILLHDLFPHSRSALHLCSRLCMNNFNHMHMQMQTQKYSFHAHSFYYVIGILHSFVFRITLDRRHWDCI